MSASQTKISKLLVANRGEIATRIFRTCKEHGIATVAVYSEGDKDAPHVSAADEAYCVGPTPSAQSYLKVDAILDAVSRSGADAVHPGYGFLSERSHFAKACADAGIVFVGPDGHAMEVMGDKVAARQAMLAAKVPVVPGREDLSTVKEVQEAAQEIGFPVMLKASAGGGGKGMRCVEAPEALESAFLAAQRESMAAFGDDRVFIERAVMKARHVEVQLMADRHGNVIALNERDCSVQRRHQKVIEEAPCPDPSFTPELRAQMGEIACQAARAVNYVGAGTVEFLYEVRPEGPAFYFLEMNTRLQVEHPVTEATCGRDLVWDQIRIAQGELLGLSQGEVRLDGHALECRIYAEDAQRFLPSPGKILRLRWPEGPGVRVDAAVKEGSVVSSHYDPMIAKLITWGPDRERALARMQRALSETVILGIETNIAFHQRVLADAEFRAGSVDTQWVDRRPDLREAVPPESESLDAMAAAVAFHARSQATGRAGVSKAAPAGLSAWQRAQLWRR